MVKKCLKNMKQWYKNHFETWQRTIRQTIPRKIQKLNLAGNFESSFEKNRKDVLNEKKECYEINEPIRNIRS